MLRIYVLCDPNTGDVRYVGATKASLEDRLDLHCKIWRHPRPYGNSPVKRWVLGLRELEQVPVIVLLEETDDPSRETHWITYYEKRGIVLLNVSTTGGPEAESLRRPKKGKLVHPFAQ